jgi:RNA polymerase sigma-70 factor (ECF subfamily)
MPHSSDPPPHDQFHTTEWSVVLRAGRPDDSDAATALARLCERYWYPLYAYARRRTGNVHAAQDLTQAFVARLLETNAVGAASPDRGRFRAFLLTALKNFLTNEHERAGAQKRGGGLRRLSLDFDSGETRYAMEPRDDATPERLFERRWAFEMLDAVMARLAAEHASAGKSESFEVLRATLVGDREAQPYAEIAQRLGTTPEAARQAARRLRLRYRELLRDAVAQTVADPSEIDDEIRSLMTALAG